MRLYYSPTSPFVRKVSVFAIETRLDASIERIPTNPWVTDETLLADNPLSKVPTLVTDEEGLVLYDSPVICEYLDSLHAGSKLIPEAGPSRWHAMRLQALCDGILDAAVLRFLEAKRSEAQRSPDWDALQQDTIRRSLDVLEREVASWDEALNIGQIAAGCALGYLDFRFGQDNWREGHPDLSAWYEAFAQRQSMRETVPAAP